MVKAVFFGTEEFGATILEALLGFGDYEIVAVFTQPDRPAGRHQEVQASPVKVAALRHGLKIYQPEKLPILPWPATDYDLNIVCQYGLIIPPEILNAPKKGSVNVHTSLLPKYRAASPIQSALMNGETETGVTIMLMDEKMDHGPVLAQEMVPVAPDDFYPALSGKLAVKAKILLLNTLPEWLGGRLDPAPQDENAATYCHVLKREDGRVDFNKSAAEIYNQFRALTPWPGVWFMWREKRVKLLKIMPSVKIFPGGKLAGEERRLFLGCAGGALEILELQVEGKKPMDAQEFISGYHV